MNRSTPLLALCTLLAITPLARAELVKEYGCKNDTAQTISYTMYAARMATGEVVGRMETHSDVQKLTQNPGGTGAFWLACGR